ncbi:tetratricopeptide repeat protein [Parasphingorhabdus sp.]|uniref:tetratricopeptide repeat protein n=1 Tax=Parasphingorhabdus sp. TaxID=2709688 RepID=UPI003265A321
MSVLRSFQKQGAATLVLTALLIATGIAAQSTAVASDGNADARAALVRAQQHNAQGDPRSARIALMNAIKSDPLWIEARLLQSETLLRLGDGIGAQSELDRAIELGTASSSVRHLYGHALQLQGNLNKAKEQLQAVDIAPDHIAYATRILGRVAMLSGDNALAGQSFDRAIRLEPENSDLWVDVAKFRAASGNQAGAIAAVDEAVKLNNENIAALQYRGELVRSQFGLRAALPWFERALQIDPNNVAVLTEYAATLGDMGRMKDMLVVARKIISLDGKNPRAFFLQSVLAARAGKYDLARTLMQKTEGRLDDVPAVILTQGIIEHEEGNFNAAIDRFRRLISMQPNNRKVRNLLARSLYLAGDAKEAWAFLEPQVMRSGTEPYVLWLAARAREASGERDQATGLLNRAAAHDVGKEVAFATSMSLDLLRAQVQRDPGDARTVIPYIRALTNAGNNAEAFTQARKLQNANPGVSDAHILVADVAMARGDYRTALSALEKAKTIRFSEPVLLRMVESLRADGDLQKSGELLAEYLSYNPRSTAALRWMAYAHLETENWDVARRILENLRARIGPNDALIMAGLAQAYTGLGRHADAVRTGRIAYYVQPSSPVVSHVYGLALLGEGTRKKDAIDLISKAVTLAPDNAVYRKSLAQAYAELKREGESDEV